MSVSDLERHESQAVETYDEVGFNYRMTDIQASIGIVQMQRLDELLRIRREKAARYDRELADIERLATPYVPPYATHTYQSYCVDLDPSVDRAEVMRKMAERGVATRRGVMATHLEKPYRSDLSLPITEAKAKSTMLIPLFPSMGDAEQTLVIEALHAAL
jgi:dTDP-4-amino-4,6-dideoxygalactose transaminase